MSRGRNTSQTIGKRKFKLIECHLLERSSVAGLTDEDLDVGHAGFGDCISSRQTHGAVERMGIRTY
jgi:hypothetical protein